MSERYLTWEECDFIWEEFDIQWDSIFIEVEEAVRKGGGYQEYVDGNPWKKLERDIGREKTKKIIKLYCKVNGIEYEKSSESLDIKVTVNEFERFVKNGISVKVNLNK